MATDDTEMINMAELVDSTHLLGDVYKTKHVELTERLEVIVNFRKTNLKKNKRVVMECILHGKTTDDYWIWSVTCPWGAVDKAEKWYEINGKWYFNDYLFNHTGIKDAL